MSESGERGRDLSGLVVSRAGGLVLTSDEREPYRLIGADGQVVESVSVFLRDLLAAGKSAAALRSYGLDLLRWWRFLDAVGIGWDRASRAEARDFSCWIQLTVKQRLQTSRPRAARWSSRAAGAPNLVTGKPAAGDGYAPATVAHSETVLPRFYDFHRDAGTGPVLNPVPAGHITPVEARPSASQPDGGVEARAGGALPAGGAAADSPRHPRQLVQPAVRGAVVEPGPGAGGVLGLYRCPGGGAAGDAPVRHLSRPAADQRG